MTDPNPSKEKPPTQFVAEETLAKVSMWLADATKSGRTARNILSHARSERTGSFDGVIEFLWTQRSQKESVEDQPDRDDFSRPSVASNPNAPAHNGKKGRGKTPDNTRLRNLIIGLTLAAIGKWTFSGMESRKTAEIKRIISEQRTRCQTLGNSFPPGQNGGSTDSPSTAAPQRGGLPLGVLMKMGCPPIGLPGPHPEAGAPSASNNMEDLPGSVPPRGTHGLEGVPTKMPEPPSPDN